MDELGQRKAGLVALSAGCAWDASADGTWLPQYTQMSASHVQQRDEGVDDPCCGDARQYQTLVRK